MIKNKFSIRRALFVFLLTVVVCSSYFLAKYVSTFQGGGEAGVAKWSVDFVSGSDTVDLIAGNTEGSYVVNVTSLSDVALDYDIILTNVPNGMEVEIDGGAFKIAGADGITEFDKVGSFTIDDADVTHTHEIVFDAPLGSDIPNSNQINVDVRFSQND